jgi:mannuronan 5-epimerase
MLKHRISVILTRLHDVLVMMFEKKEIKLTCKLAHLLDIYNQLTDRTILNKEGQLNDSNNSNIWLLNAGITVEKGSTLVIDPKDTKWLKIFDDRKIAYPIIVHGSLLIDSVKVTSWDPNTNDYVKFDPEYYKIKNMNTRV